MNMTESSCAVHPQITASKRNRFVLRCVCFAAVTAALMVCGAVNSWAQFTEYDFTWYLPNSGNWSDSTRWTTNVYDQFDTNLVVEIGCTNQATGPDWVKTNIQVCAPGVVSGYPGWGGDDSGPAYQSAFFTNAGTYTVTLDVAGLAIASNVFATASNATANVTFNLNGNYLNAGAALIVGTKYASTTTLTITNATSNYKMYGITVGQRGLATVIFNSGTLDNGGGSINLGTGDDGRGVFIVSGPTAKVWPTSQISVGNDPQQSPAGSALILTNGGKILCTSSFRLGSGSGKGGSSNNLIEIHAGSVLTCDSGPETIGLRSTGVTNSDGGTLCFNNVLLVKSGGVWACANTSSKTVCVGDTSFFGGSQSATANPPAICTGNVLRVETYGVVTGASTFWITPTNTVDLQGALLEASCISNWGTMIAYGTHRGEERIFKGGTLKTRNLLGKLVISNGLWMVTNSVLEVEVGAGFNPTEVFFNGGTNRLTIDQATLNIVGTPTQPSYDLIVYSTNVPPGPPAGWGVGTNALGITNFTGFASINGPSPYSYSIDTNTYGKIKLNIGGLVNFRIVSATRSGSDVVLKWTETAGVTNVVQSTTGGTGGNYSTNAFADIPGSTTVTPASQTNTYTHVNGATGSATRYYRIRRVP